MQMPFFDMESTLSEHLEFIDTAELVTADSNRPPPPSKVPAGGSHLILELVVDCESVDQLTDTNVLQHICSKAARAAGATKISSHFHSFGDQQGVTGVILLAESHLTIHTWPAERYAAIDLFVCGNCNPYYAIAVLENGLNAETTRYQVINRGVPTSDQQTVPKMVH